MGKKFERPQSPSPKRIEAERRSVQLPSASLS